MVKINISSEELGAKTAEKRMDIWWQELATANCTDIEYARTKNCGRDVPESKLRISYTTGTTFVQGALLWMNHNLLWMNQVPPKAVTIVFSCGRNMFYADASSHVYLAWYTVLSWSTAGREEESTSSLMSRKSRWLLGCCTTEILQMASAPGPPPLP